MNPTLRAHLNFWGGAIAAALAGWLATDQNASVKAVICAIAIPFVTSIVQQTRENPLQGATDAIKARLPGIGGLFLLVLCLGCASIPKFDQNSVNNANALKDDATMLLGGELTPVPTNSITLLQSRLDAAVAYETGKGKGNWASRGQWEIMANRDGALLGAFLTRWLTGVALSGPYVAEKKRQVADGFDEILKLEGAKLR
jgi:hypothetical protein